MNFYNFFNYLIVVLILILIDNAYPQNAILGGKSTLEIANEDYFVLTPDQKTKLDKFMDLFVKVLPHDYMKEPKYLIRFLKVADFNLQAATRLLKENLKWREENKMDSIIDEDWSDLQAQYKFTVDGCDSAERPNAVFYVGDWDVRKAVIAGKGRRLMRFADKIYEEANLILRNMQAQGSNATRVNLIIELSNFNFQQHLCAGCIPLYGYMVYTLHRHFPLTINYLILINTPQAALPMWEVVKPLMPPLSREFVQIYGRNEKEWKEALLTKHGIDPKKFSKDLGGNGPEAKDFDNIRTKDNYYYECHKD